MRPTSQPAAGQKAFKSGSKQPASQPASQRGLGRSGLEAMSMSRLVAIVALLSLGCSISFCSFLEPGHPLELWLSAVKVVGEYIVHSAAIVEDVVSYLSSVRILWLVALALVSLFGKMLIKKALRFMKKSMESGGLRALRESYIEKRMMAYMYASIVENPDLIRQLHNAFHEWNQKKGLFDWFRRQAKSLQTELLMSGNALGLSIHEKQWLLTFSVFIDELKHDIKTYTQQGWDCSAWEAKLRILRDRADEWIECAFVEGPDALCALRQEVTSAPLQKVDHVLSTLRQQIRESMHQNQQVCEMLQDIQAVQLDICGKLDKHDLSHQPAEEATRHSD